MSNSILFSGNFQKSFYLHSKNILLTLTMFRNVNQDYLRSFVFGCQDALVSTAGIIVGVATAVPNKQYIVLTGLVAIMVEALSMTAGQYLSEKSVHQLPGSHHHDSLFVGSLTMFIAYLIGGFIPILPILIAPLSISPLLSVLFSFAGLFLLGYLKGKYFTGHSIYNSLEMMIVGGLTVLIGVFVGSFFRL